MSDSAGRLSTALITGASAGIGHELALVFAERGHDLVVVARREALLESLARRVRQEHGREVRVLARDLLDPRAPDEILATLESEGVEVDVLVNDAGVLELGRFEEMDPADVARMVDLNTRALTLMTRAFLPPMRARGRGRLLNVASAAAFQPIPSLAVYAATKAFVLSLTEALSEELAGSGVTATAVCPGLTTTEMTDRAKEANETASYFPDALMSDARSVARDAYAACMAGHVIEVPGIANRVLTDWSRLQPRWLVRTVGGLVGRRILGS